MNSFFNQMLLTILLIIFVISVDDFSNLQDILPAAGVSFTTLVFNRQTIIYLKIGRKNNW